MEKSKKRFYVYFSALFAVVVLLGIFSLLGSKGITSVVQVPAAEGITTALKSFPAVASGIQPGLFDITVTIPEQSRVLKSGEPLQAAISLTNLGVQKTEATLTYLVIREDGGELVYIEHEKKTVETQEQFFKTIPLQKLPPGAYRLYAHLLYGEATATASEEFQINLN